MEVAISFLLGLLLGASVSALILVLMWTKSIVDSATHLDEIERKFNELCDQDKKIIGELLNNKDK